MNINKPVTITLAVIIGVLTIYAIASGRNSFKKIKSLTSQIEHTVDSLSFVQERYDSLSLAYNAIETQLTATQDNLTRFKHDLDSLLALRMRSIATLNQALDEVIERQDSVQRLDSLNNSFRFK